MRPEIDHNNVVDRASVSKSVLESGLKALNYHMGINEPGQNPNTIPNSIPNHNFDNSGWGYCTEEQLEEILLKNLEFLYNEAISKLVSLGYDEDHALKAILRNGHCYGSMDVLTNILQNSLSYLNGGCADNNLNNSDESDPSFVDLRQLEEYSLAGMVCLLQQVRPHLTKGDAMWCLLMSDLHVGRASTMDIPVLPSPNNACNPSTGSIESVSSNSVGVAPALCKFHGGWGFTSGGPTEAPVNGFFSYSSDSSLQRDIEFPKRFNLTPSMKSLLRRNVEMFAAGFRASSNSKQLLDQSNENPSSLSYGDEIPTDQCEETHSSKNQDVLNSLMGKFRELNLEENLEVTGEDQKDQMIFTLIHQIKDLSRQVQERKEWAHQKAMQAARRLCNDLTELKMLRMERDETQRLKKGKQTLEDTTMKRLSEMENALRKASGQVDRANAAVRRLETENAEIRAEMEACKLSASESVSTCLEAAKREKKCLKRLLVWEKQKSKLQEEIAEEKQKISELQRALIQIEEAKKQVEVKWRQESKAKEEAAAQVEEERRLKEAVESTNKRKLEALRLKTEIDSQRYKDDLQRLEQELSRLKASSEYDVSNTSPKVDPAPKSQRGGTIARLLHELEEDPSENGLSSDRECLMCMKEEVSIVFLPCAHQIMCSNCSDEYGKDGKVTCPCCRSDIEQRVRVFGASS